ncbi:ABC transporter ATP-binding protein [Protofrankia symbiont of Coriaria ruscifolia]|uniref:Aliphatic sulfonates import ATP-binding protein SsuB 2 n=1 Tax=Candidatus Protofrankia californiensis TaxID=1839754 RepID=A0A1C3NTA0_9ACTN|nr:ABC transporter ATP-binding protein [Protofrankia symbiont of Coriaria ruscifolia]SBW17643.1 Aliphatic sulfonates import ATP-binding protein SsuB 2 [Candidatus Protofrankia californiensis]
MATSIQRSVTTLLGPDVPGASPAHPPVDTADEQPDHAGTPGTSEGDRTPANAPAAATVTAPEGTPLAVGVRNLRRAFGANIVINDLDLDVPVGQFVALLGASGCGKSTLLRILADLDTEISGQVRVASRRAVAFQAPRLLPWKRVWRNVVLGLPGRPDKARAVAALEEVGLARRADAWPRTLSGGEAQRASLARALVRDPELMLLDEPFGALDALTRIRVQGLVEQLWQRHNPAILLVTHDVEEALLLADRVLVMKDGVIAHSADITLARPRNVSDPQFVALRAELLGWLGVGHAPSGAAGPEAAGGQPAQDVDHPVQGVERTAQTVEPDPAADTREPPPRRKILS